MNTTQAAAILDALLAGFPKAALNDAQLESWTDAIQDSGAEPDRAQEVAYRWPRTHEWFPSLAEFLAVICPRQPAQPLDDPDEWRVPPAVAHRMAREWRVAFDAASKKVAGVGSGRGVDGHWHGGGPSNPCPVCGGYKS